MTSFVATSAPTGWKLGRWSKIDDRTWEERKLDNQGEAYTFDAASGGDSKSTAVRLAMRGTATEVLITETSVQIFVDGRYFGEYVGFWEQGSGGGRGAPPPVARGAPPPVQSRGFADPGPPVQQASFAMKSAPPMTSAAPPPVGRGPPPVMESNAPGAVGRSAPTYNPPAATAAPRGAPMGSAPMGAPMAAAPVASGRPQKQPGLDSSPQMAEKLFIAAKNGSMDEVQRLLQTVDPDAQTREGLTALYAATIGGHKAIVEALIDAGADPSIGKGGKTPLVAAYEKGNKEILSALFAATFQTLETAVGPGGLTSGRPRGEHVADDDIPAAAFDELKEVTAKLAALGKSQTADDWKSSMQLDDMPTSTDSDITREEAVRVAMRGLVQANDAK